MIYQLRTVDQYISKKPDENLYGKLIVKTKHSNTDKLLVTSYISSVVVVRILAKLLQYAPAGTSSKGGPYGANGGF